MPQIELLTITTPGSRVAPRATWAHGRDRACAATPAAVAAALSVCEPDADAVLVFDASLPLPPVPGRACVFHAARGGAGLVFLTI